MKFKEYIQSEVNQKEVEPSHDAFDRIQARLNNQSEIVVEKSSTKKWYAIAATIVGLAVCTTLFFTQNKTQNTEIVSTEVETKNDVISSKESIEDQSKIEIENEVQLVEKSTLKEKEDIKVEPLKSENSEPIIEIAVQSTKEIEQEKPKVSNPIPTPSLANGFKQNQTQIATNLDTVKVNSKKKGNYVDPNMLLYSIENKESLKESNNQKSKVAVIDLNKK